MSSDNMRTATITCINNAQKTEGNEIVRNLKSYVKLTREYGHVNVAFSTVYGPASKPDKDEIKRATVSIRNEKYNEPYVENLLKNVHKAIEKRKICVEKKSEKEREESLHEFVFDDIGELSEEVKNELRTLAAVEKEHDTETE